MNNIIANIRTQLQKLKCRIANLSNRVTYIEDNCCNGGGSGIQSIQEGDNISIDNTDPNNPIINILEVSATESGIVNNTPLQELGGVDKLINGVRIGRGEGSSVENNTVVGGNVLLFNTTGSNLTAFGEEALSKNTTGDYNVAFGDYSLWSNTTGEWNTAFGSASLPFNTTGHRNVAVGTSLYWNTTGHRNTGVGLNAGYAQTTGSYNTYVGNSTGYDAGVGNYNVAIGYGAFATAIGGYNSAGSTRNNNNNVFIGSRITIPDEVNNVFAVDNKGNTATAYDNALLYGNFADRFLRINGRFEVAPSTMPVADAGFTKKLVWNPTTGVVGEADDAGGEQQFVQITEGSNTGWGLKYRADNPNRYGDIGNRAVDFSYSGTNSTTRGATSKSSTIAGGENNTASANYSTISGGYNNTASGNISTVSGGSINTASGTYSTVSGGEYNTASGSSSTVSGGIRNEANSYGEWVGGLHGTIPTGQNPTSWVATNRLFNIGNGTAYNNRSDAFTILKNGLATLPSVTNTLIDAEPTGKAVATKEWVLANSGGGGDFIPLTGTEVGSPVTGSIIFDGETFSTHISKLYKDGAVPFNTYGFFQVDNPDEIYISSSKVFGLYSMNVNEEKFYFRPSKEDKGFVVDTYLGDISNNESVGLQGAYYYGANYDDNTYVQKKYVDDAIDAIPTPSLTLEQARQNGSEVDGWIQFKGSTFTTGIFFQAEVHQVQDRRISIKKDADDNLLISNYPNTNNEKAIIAVNHDGSIRMTVNPDDPTDKIYTFDNTGIFSSTYNGASSNNHYVQRQYVSNNFIAKPTEGTSGQVLTTDGAGSYTWEDVEVQTYLQSITGYDAGATQTLKNVAGVLTWVTD